MSEYEIVIKSPDGGFKRIWTKELFTADDVGLENDELIIAGKATRISCTFVKCKYNEYGKKGVCQAREIQISGPVYPGQHNVKAVCVHFTKNKEEY